MWRLRGSRPPPEQTLCPSTVPLAVLVPCTPNQGGTPAPFASAPGVGIARCDDHRAALFHHFWENFPSEQRAEERPRGCGWPLGCFWGAELWGHNTGAEPRRKPHAHVGAHGAETWEHGGGCLGFFTARGRRKLSCSKEKFTCRKRSPPLTTAGHGISENPILGGPLPRKPAPWRRFCRSGCAANTRLGGALRKIPGLQRRWEKGWRLSTALPSPPALCPPQGRFLGG